MSLLSSLLQQLIGTETEENVTERPCSNCPGDCVIASQGACPECEPFKKKLIDEIYHVNHLEEFYDRYEVTGTAAAGSESVSGTVTCPVCGARSANPYVCEYCDTPLAEAPASSGKIKVERASDIPNPIMNAQNIIFERYDTVTKKYMSSKESQSLLGELFEALTGIDDDEDDSLGTKMSESEIKEAAELYKMSIGDYLTGLDNGTCLTLKGKKAADQQAQFTSAASEPASFGIPGIAGLGLLGSALIHQTEIPPYFHRPPGPTFQQGGFHQFPPQNKPPQGQHQLFSSSKPQNSWPFRSDPEESAPSNRPKPGPKDHPHSDKNPKHRPKDDVHRI